MKNKILLLGMYIDNKIKQILVIGWPCIVV